MRAGKVVGMFAGVYDDNLRRKQFVRDLEQFSNKAGEQSGYEQLLARAA